MKVQFTDAEINIMQTALDQWGLSEQVGQVVVECAELIVALQKYINRTPKPGVVENITDEIAAVEIHDFSLREKRHFVPPVSS